MQTMWEKSLVSLHGPLETSLLSQQCSAEQVKPPGAWGTG